MQDNRPQKIPAIVKAVICLFIGVITMRELSYHVAPGLDEPYRWALNYFLGNNKQILATITYTYGPLCLLKWPIAIGDHILIASLFNIILNATFTYTIISLHTVVSGNDRIVKPILLSIAFLLFVSIDYVFIGIVAACLIHVQYDKKQWTLWVALLFTAIGMYIKTSLLALLASIWLMFVVYSLVKKQYRIVLSAIGGGIIIYFLLGLVIFHDVAATFSYGVNNISMAFEYTDALNLYPQNDVKYLVVSVIALVAAYLLVRKDEGRMVFILLSLAFFANWKYAMGYEDFWHAVSFLYLAALALILLLVVQRRMLLMITLLFCLCIGSYAHNLKHLVHYRKELIGLPDISLFNEWVLHHKENKERTWNNSLTACKVNELPEEWRMKIGNSTVDIIPFDLSIALANNLNYKPRPTMQAGLPGPKYDRLDAASYAKPSAAEYVVWHTVNAGKTNLDGIDDNYLPNTNPNLINAVLTHYHPTPYSNEKYTIWQRNSVPHVPKRKVMTEMDVKWGEWMPVMSVDSGDVLRAIVDVQTNLKYKLRSAVYKGLPVYVEYATSAGKIYRYRFSASQAKEGMLLQPFFTHHDMSAEQVMRIRFINERPEYYHEQLHLQLYQLDF